MWWPVDIRDAEPTAEWFWNETKPRAHMPEMREIPMSMGSVRNLRRLRYVLPL